MDLPVDDDAATLSDYADVVVEALGERREDLIVVAQSYGGYVAPIVCDRVPARLIVLVAAMIPSPAESADQMWVNTPFGDAARPETDASGDLAIFYDTFHARWRKRRCPRVAVRRRRHRQRPHACPQSSH